MLTIGSVCSGIGAFELAARSVGLGPVKWQVEIDPYCRAILARHWPDAVRHEDLTDVSTRPADLGSVDIICGGTPCQDMSSAGAKAGIEGARSSLWFHMLAVVAHVRPRFVVWENVPGSLRRGMERVVEGLDAIGYEVVGTQLSAADVGAPHRRARVFVVGFSPDAAGGHVANANGKGQQQPQGPVADVGRRIGDGREPPRGFSWPAEPAVPRVAHGVPARMDRERALGNAIVVRDCEVALWLVRDIWEGRVKP